MKHKPNYVVSRKPIHGFTLIELLVVISIIALLLSILMPSLGAAKEAAKQVVCSSNLRGVGLAQLMYADDYNGWSTPLMSGYSDPADIYNTNWTGDPWSIMLLGGYNDTKFFNCPSWGTHGENGEYSFGMRRNYHQTPFRIGSGRVKTPASDQSGVIFGSPSTFLFIADSMYYWASPPHQYFYFNTHESYLYSPTVHLRHSGRQSRTANFLFGDGHLEKLGKEDLLGNYGITNYQSASGGKGAFSFIEDAIVVRE